MGCCIAAVGAAAWVVTENICDQDDAIGHFFRWFPGHLIWHSTCAYGMCNAMLFAAVLRADNFRTKVYIRTDTLYFKLLPRVYYDAAGGIVSPLEPSSELKAARMARGGGARVAPTPEFTNAEELEEVEEFIPSPCRAPRPAIQILQDEHGNTLVAEQGAARAWAPAGPAGAA